MMKKITGILTLTVLLSVVLTGCAVTKDETAQGKTDSRDLQIDINAEADAEIEADINEASALLMENGALSAEIWPEYNLSQNAVIVCRRDDSTNKVIQAWKLTTEGKSNLTNDELSGVEIPAAGGYKDLEFQGKKSIIIAVSRNTTQALKDVAVSNYIYEIGVHEMVHFHYESMFKLMKLGIEQTMHGGRGTEFPKAAEPRVYRKMLYDNLVEAFEKPEDEDIYLGRAKYWNEKWKTEYPKEYYQAKITDIMEGKARYIQYMLCIPHDISDGEKAERIAELFDKSTDPSVSIDSESYKLGFAAGVLLDRQGSDWKTQITKKPEPPVEYLLENVETVKDDAQSYKEKLKISEKHMAEINKETDKKLENIKTAESDTQIPFLVLNGKYLAGSFETSDFVNYNGKSLTVDFGGTFESKNGTVIVSQLSVYEKNGLIKSKFILPLTMEYELSDGRLKLDSDGVSGDIQVKQTKDKDGRIIYTMK